jgi:hypothetical protein
LSSRANGVGETVAVERATEDAKAELERMEEMNSMKQFQT